MIIDCWLPDLFIIMSYVSFMTLSILLINQCILKIKPIPYFKVLVIVVSSFIFWILFFSILHAPLDFIYLFLPIWYFGLSYLLFKSSFRKMIYFISFSFVALFLGHLMLTKLVKWYSQCPAFWL